nr:hypothetical protein [Tanacetum cinerariifolium]
MLLIIPCLRECKIVGQLLVDHALSYTPTATADVPNKNETIRFMVDMQEITCTVDMFRSNLKLPVETPEQSFIPPATLKFIQPFLKIVGYQGLKDVIQYPRFTKLIISDIMNKFDSIPKRLEEEYHSIKDDTLLVSVYTTRNVTVRGMLILNDFLTHDIRETKTYKDYEKEFKGVDIPTIQPQPEKKPSTFIPHPSDDRKRDEIHKATQLSLIMHKTTKAAEEQENVAAPEKKILEDDVEKLIEGEDDDSYATNFGDLIFFNDEEDFGNRIEPGSHKEHSKTIDDDDDEEKKKDNKKDDDDNNDDDYTDHASIKTQVTGSLEIRTEKMKHPFTHPLDPLGKTYPQIRLLIRIDGLYLINTCYFISKKIKTYSQAIFTHSTSS